MVIRIQRRRHVARRRRTIRERYPEGADIRPKHGPRLLRQRNFTSLFSRRHT
jgi:hypothetical protein